jgi:hypothetical protein
VIAFVSLCAPAGWSQMTQNPLRTLSGVVTDGGHEPIRGAVVELRDDRNNEVVTYLTDTNGHYSFKRMDSGADYEVWVLFRGHRSPTHSISKFDSHLQKVIDFKVRTF